jgi:uncharacterized membrane protein
VNFRLDGFTENDSLMAVVANLFDLAYTLAGPLAVIFIILGGFRYVMAGGNQQKAEKAKGTVVHALVGLVVIFLSFLIVQEVFRVLRVDTSRFSLGGFEFDYRDVTGGE